MMSSSTRLSLPDTLEAVTAEIGAIQATLVESLQDELVCAVCGCIFIDPRVLRCQHCFCLRCLYSTVARDRMPQLEIPCAYRCEKMTVTKGDIRTLPKNHYITNACILLRHHLTRRAQLLEKKFQLLREQTEVAETSSPMPSSSVATAVTPLSAETETVVTSSRPVGGMLRKEKDLVAELYECEWCSCSSPSCEVCPYCWSRICAECRGQFSDHQFLCVEPNQPGRWPPEGWLPGTTPADVTALPTTTLDNDSSVAHQSVATATMEANEGQGAIAVAGNDASFPFFFTPFFIPTLVKECLVKQHSTPLQLSEIDVTNVTPVRLKVPEFAVQCQHHTTGFSFDYVVFPTFSTAEGVTVDLNMLHWTEGDGKPSSTLSFLANATRLGEAVLQDLNRLSTATSDVVLELSSAAHQAYVRCSKGFHMYALHVWMLVRAQCQIACDGLLPHLERSRLLENITSNLVTYRFQQTMGHASLPQKHVIQDRCIAFLKTEIKLCRQLDQVIEGIDATCRGIYTLLGRMLNAMKELAQPKVHRGEEHKKSRQSRLRFSLQLFRSREVEHNQQCQQEQKPGKDEQQQAGNDSTELLAQAPSSSSTRRSPPHTIPLSDVPIDPTSSDAAGTDTSFRSQLDEHHGVTQALTDSLVSILRCFMQARVWEWSLSNTCIRECGLGEEDRRTLLQIEETLQLLTDDLTKQIWGCGRLMYVLELQLDEAGPASFLDVLMDTEALALLDLGMENKNYEHKEVMKCFKTFSKLQNSLLDVLSANIIAAQSPNFQQELLDLVTSGLKTTMQHQAAVMRVVTVSEKLYESRFASYLRMRHMTPYIGTVPPINEDKLLAVEVLKTLQQHGSALAFMASTEAAPSSLSDVANGRGDGQQEGHPVTKPSGLHTVTPGRKDLTELLTVATVASPREAHTATQVLFTDFSRRDTALLSCLRYGEALVRAANGHSLDEGRSMFDTEGGPSGGGAGGGAMAALTAAAAGPTGLLQLQPLPSLTADAAGSSMPSAEAGEEKLYPLLLATEEEPPSIPTVTAPMQVPGVLTGNDGDHTDVHIPVETAPRAYAVESSQNECPERQLPSTPMGTDNFPVPQLGGSSLSTGDVTAAENARDSSSSRVPSLTSPVAEVAATPEDDAAPTHVHHSNPTHDELLFEADCSDLPVETALVKPSPADANGSRKASELFKTTFQLPATTRTVSQRRIACMPFYRGDCTYKGMSTTFYVDAQTGVVSVHQQLLSARGRWQYVLEVLSSPLFFILFNSALSILVHKRYQLEVFYK